MILYKSIGKKQFADSAGISPFQLREWLAESYEDIKPMGYQIKSKKLMPAVVKYLSEKYGVIPENATVL